MDNGIDFMSYLRRTHISSCKGYFPKDVWQGLLMKRSTTADPHTTVRLVQALHHNAALISLSAHEFALKKWSIMHALSSAIRIGFLYKIHEKS